MENRLQTFYTLIIPQKTRRAASGEQYLKLSFKLYMCPGMHPSHIHVLAQAQLKRRKLLKSEESPHHTVYTY